MNENNSILFKSERIAAGFTQGFMAEQLGISERAYMEYESGEKIPDVDTLIKIVRLLQKNKEKVTTSSSNMMPSMVREAGVQYGVQTERLSVEDYFALEDCGEYELIKGRLVHRNAPGYEHQRIVLKFSMVLEQYLQEHCGKCEVVPAPFCVVLDEEESVVVQPDISVICRPEMIEAEVCYGPPDIVVEVLSPATADFDMFEKLVLYKKYGVGEYWIVNPKDRRVILYDLESGNSPVIGSFETEIPSFRIKGFALNMSELM